MIVPRIAEASLRASDLSNTMFPIAACARRGAKRRIFPHLGSDRLRRLRGLTVLT